MPQAEHNATDVPSIKHATREDVPEILAMIHELAAYENATSEVEATEESLARTLSFEPPHGRESSNVEGQGYARTLLLRLPSTTTERYQTEHTDDTPNAVAGMALYFYNYSTWRAKPGIYLEDLFVRPQYRKRGYGKLLIRELARLCVDMDGGRLEWACLTWNTPSLQFYEALGAEQKKEWVGLRVDGDRLIALAQGRSGV